MDGAAFLILEVFDVAFLLLHLEHLLLDFLLEAGVHADDDEDQYEDAQHSDYDVEFGVLFTNAAGQVGTL